MISEDTSSEDDLDPICLVSFGDDSGSPLFKGWRPGRHRRCGAKTVSLTGGDAHANSHRGLDPGRHSLYSDEDYLSPTVFFLEPRRRGQKTYLQDINSIRLVLLQQFLEVESLRNKIEPNSRVRSRRFYRLSTRLPGFGNVARVALWGATPCSKFGLYSGSSCSLSWFCLVSLHMATKVSVQLLLIHIFSIFKEKSERI